MNERFTFTYIPPNPPRHGYYLDSTEKPRLSSVFPSVRYDIFVSNIRFWNVYYKLSGSLYTYS